MIKGIVVHEQKEGVSLNDFQEFALGMRQSLSSITSQVVTAEHRTLVYTNKDLDGSAHRILVPITSDCDCIEIEFLCYKGYPERVSRRVYFKEENNITVSGMSFGSDGNNFWMNARNLKCSFSQYDVIIDVNAGSYKSQGNTRSSSDANAMIPYNIYTIENVKCIQSQK